MFLKRLEINGFKSFPNKAKIEFNKGITAIVGPNGSGKSNVLDAILWVLGEQSAKNLRGAKMEDVIFGGTANRRPMSYAEVTIVIDNSQGFFDVEFDEVSITRKVYRNGEGEYFINKKHCRLKDIHELLMDTGVGKDGYSIISQGKVNEIIGAKNNDIRQFFDEAAGIVKFRAKKQEALSNLQKEHDNLDRVNDIISELETQVEPLEQESEKAKKFLVLEDELRSIEITKYVKDIDTYDKEIFIAKKDLSKINIKLDRLQFNLKNEEKSRTKIAEQIETISQDINDKNITKEQITYKINKLDNDVVRNEESIQFALVDKGRLTRELDEMNKELISVTNKIELKNTEIVAKKIAKNNVINDFTAFENQFSSVVDNIHILDENKEEISNNLENAVNSKNNYIIEQNKLKEKLSIETKNLSYYNNETAILNQSIKNNKVTKNVFEKKIDILKTDIDLIDQNIKSLRSNNLTVSNNIKNEEQSYISISNEINKTSNRKNFLENMINEGEIFSKSVKYILDNKSKIKGVHNSLGNLIIAKNEYAIAIEVALGNSVQNIVVDDEYIAKQCIDELKKTRFGRATFLPLNVIKKRFIKHDLTNEIGFVDIASNLVSNEEKYDNIVQNVLGATAIVDTISNAIRISKKYNNSIKIVTISGEQFNIGGSITGGNTNKNRQSVISTRAEIEDLTSRLHKLNTTQKEINTKIEQYNNNLTEIQLNLNENIENHNNKTVELKQITIEEQNIINVINDNEIKLNKYTNDKLNCENCIKSIKIQIQNLEEEVQNIENLIKNYNKNISSINELSKKNEDDRINYYNKSSEFKLNINQLEGEIQNLNIELENSKLSQNNTELKIKNIKAQIKNISENLDEKANISRKYNLEKEKLNTELNTISSDIKNANTLKENLNSMHNNTYKNAEELKHEIFQNDANKISISKNIENIEYKRDNLHNYIWSKYELSIASCREFDFINTLINDSNLGVQENLLKSKIKALGHVNVGAIEQFIALNDRFNFLVSQRDDIINAENNLIELIDNLTKDMQERFIEQFNIIQENFDYVFKELFGGGEAKLLLTDADNILESNIEIKAQPPGKKLNHMTLLSGGEKALTAISLLFAILKMKPTPFCILDEVEAALDESNVKKYGEYLQYFVDTTQFIVITHRNGTMEASDTLYGITMQEKGVSTLVSVEF